MKTPAHKLEAMERNAASIRVLFELLLDAISNPREAPAGLFEACQSQGRLAKFTYLASDGPKSGRAIHPVSLNTLKTTADRIVKPGGFAKLDHMRRSALQALSSASDIQKQRKNASRQETASRETIGRDAMQLANLVDSISDFSERYNDLLRLTRNIINRASEGKFNRENEERLLRAHLERSLLLPKPCLRAV